MKIFNWVHKTHNLLKDGLARNVKKTDSIAIDTNSKVLLDQVALFELLDGWRYGVLTIRTFGFDTLKSLGHQKGHLASENDDDDQVKTKMKIATVRKK
ncbi:cytochrome b5 isoform A-like isoform X1 [Hibiscus syriacus]|uniref:Protein TILLER ANGLE CONTROL 1 n=1 Tax=Hibiscus syriacus TaxID=106335 RepID=A0A6A2XV49_HIBSY|nr:cytochrome b5 isoform A-like isoform X1 [Hibiscus syriacus]